MFSDMVFGRHFRLFGRHEDTRQIAPKVDGVTIRMAEDGTLSAAPSKQRSTYQLQLDESTLRLIVSGDEAASVELPEPVDAELTELSEPSLTVSPAENNLLAVDEQGRVTLPLDSLLRVLAGVVNEIFAASADTFGQPAGTTTIEVTELAPAPIRPAPDDELITRSTTSDPDPGPPLFPGDE